MSTSGARKGDAPAEDSDRVQRNFRLSFIEVEEVDDAAPLTGELFLRKFKHSIPDYPRHFVAFYLDADGTRRPIGYVHYLQQEEVFLCGGMCVDVSAYRHMPAAHLNQLRAAGSLAEYMLRQTFEMLGPCAAIFGSVGDATARVVDLRAGFVDTGVPNLMVVWRDAMDHQKDAIVSKVVALGSF
jgi:hypothetical protein